MPSSTGTATPDGAIATGGPAGSQAARHSAPSPTLAGGAASQAQHARPGLSVAASTAAATSAADAGRTATPSKPRLPSAAASPDARDSLSEHGAVQTPPWQRADALAYPVGVSFSAAAGRYQACVYVHNGTLAHLGLFSTANEAEQVFRKACKVGAVTLGGQVVSIAGNMAQQAAKLAETGMHMGAGFSPAHRTASDGFAPSSFLSPAPSAGMRSGSALSHSGDGAQSHMMGRGGFFSSRLHGSISPALIDAADAVDSERRFGLDPDVGVDGFSAPTPMHPQHASTTEYYSGILQLPGWNIAMDPARNKWIALVRGSEGVVTEVGAYTDRSIGIAAAKQGFAGITSTQPPLTACTDILLASQASLPRTGFAPSPRAGRGGVHRAGASAAAASSVLPPPSSAALASGELNTASYSRVLLRTGYGSAGASAVAGFHAPTSPPPAPSVSGTAASVSSSAPLHQSSRGRKRRAPGYSAADFLSPDEALAAAAAADASRADTASRRAKPTKRSRDTGAYDPSLADDVDSSSEAVATAATTTSGRRPRQSSKHTSAATDAELAAALGEGGGTKRRARPAGDSAAGSGRSNSPSKKSGVRGVSWNKSAQKWQAYSRRVGPGKGRKHLGYFATVDEAAAAVIAAEREAELNGTISM